MACRRAPTPGPLDPVTGYRGSSGPATFSRFALLLGFVVVLTIGPVLSGGPGALHGGVLGTGAGHETVARVPSAAHAGTVPDVSSVTITPSPAPIDSGQTVTLTAHPQGVTGNVTYQWYVGKSATCSSNTMITGANAPNYTASSSTGDAQYCVVAQDGSGVVADSAIDRVTVSPALSAPTIVATPSSVDVGQPVSISSAWSGGTTNYTVQLYSAAAGAPPCSANSTFVEGATTAAPSTGGALPSVSPLANTSYCLVVADSAVGTPSAVAITPVPVLVTVSPDLVVATPVASPRGSADVGQPVTFTASTSGGSGGASYAWSGIPTGCPSSSTPDVVCSDPTTPGTYPVAMTSTDSNGFTATSTPLSFSVFADPTVPAPTLLPARIDLNGTTGLSASASGGSGGFTYAWQGLPTGCSPAGATFDCRPTVSGTFAITVVATDSDDFSVTSDAAFLVVAPSLVVEVTSASFDGTTGSFSAIATGGTGPVTFVWSFGDGTEATGATVSHAYANSGRYSVEIRANDSAGDSATFSWLANAPAAPTTGPSVLGLSEAALPAAAALAGVGAIAGGLVTLTILRRRPAGRASPDLGTAPPDGASGPSSAPPGAGALSATGKPSPPESAEPSDFDQGDIRRPFGLEDDREGGSGASSRAATGEETPGTYTRKKLPGRMSSPSPGDVGSPVGEGEGSDASLGTYSRKKLPGRMTAEAPEPADSDLGGGGPADASLGTYTRKKLPGRMTSESPGDAGSRLAGGPESEATAGTYSRKKLPGRMTADDLGDAGDPTPSGESGAYMRRKLPGRMKSGEATAPSTPPASTSTSSNLSKTSASTGSAAPKKAPDQPDTELPETPEGDEEGESEDPDGGAAE